MTFLIYFNDESISDHLTVNQVKDYNSIIKLLDFKRPIDKRRDRSILRIDKYNEKKTLIGTKIKIWYKNESLWGLSKIVKGGVK